MVGSTAETPTMDNKPHPMDRFVAALMENPDLPVWDEKKSGDALVSELAIAFLKHAESRKMDKIDVAYFKRVVGFLVEIYRGLDVNEFSPKKLKTCRSQMVKAGTLCRRMINDYTRKIVRIFGWGVEEELVRGTTWQNLKAVKSLKKGEQGVRDNPPAQEVPDEVVKRTLPFMASTIAAMVKFQRITGMRPSEVYRMTLGDIDLTRDPELWYYTPKSARRSGLSAKS